MLVLAGELALVRRCAVRVQTRLGATMGGAITLPHSEPVIIIVAVIAVTISVKT